MRVFGEQEREREREKGGICGGEGGEDCRVVSLVVAGAEATDRPRQGSLSVLFSFSSPSLTPFFVPSSFLLLLLLLLLLSSSHYLIILCDFLSISLRFWFQHSRAWTHAPTASALLGKVEEESSRLRPADAINVTAEWMKTTHSQLKEEEDVRNSKLKSEETGRHWRKGVSMDTPTAVSADMVHEENQGRRSVASGTTTILASHQERTNADFTLVGSSLLYRVFQARFTLVLSLQQRRRTRESESISSRDDMAWREKEPTILEGPVTLANIEGYWLRTWNQSREQEDKGDGEKEEGRKKKREMEFKEGSRNTARLTNRCEHF